MSGFNLNDYVDVAERIRQFYEKHPDGRLTTGTPPRVVEIGGKPFVWYHARAYRSPDDRLPADGWAAEPVPGPTPYTKDSELMNAETAAWGRAIVALGFATKHIASAQDIQNRGAGKPAKAAATAAKPAQSDRAARLMVEITEAYKAAGQKMTAPQLAAVNAHSDNEEWLEKALAKIKETTATAFKAPATARGEKVTT